MSRLAVAVVASFAWSAFAHDADVIYVLVRADTSPTGLFETVTLTSATLGRLAPLDTDGDRSLTQDELDQHATALAAGVWDDMPLLEGATTCRRDGEQAWLKDGFVELEAHFHCPGEAPLRQDFRFLRVLPANYRVVLGSQRDGERDRVFAQGSLTTVELARPGQGAARWSEFLHALSDGARLAWSFVVLGAMLALGLALRSWREVARGLGALAATVLVVSGVALPPWVALVALSCGALVVAARGQVSGVWAAWFGLALGVLGGGGSVGLGAGVLVMTMPVLVAASFAVQRLRSHTRLVAGLRWGAALTAALAAASSLVS